MVAVQISPHEVSKKQNYNESNNVSEHIIVLFKVTSDSYITCITSLVNLIYFVVSHNDIILIL